MIIDRGCSERGCACYDDRVDKDGVEVVKGGWVGLTEGEIEKLIRIMMSKDQAFTGFARAIEAKLKEKNT